MGIIYKDIYYLNNCFTDIDDDYNLIKMANKRRKFYNIFYKQILLFSKRGKCGKMWQKCQNMAKTQIIAII